MTITEKLCVPGKVLSKHLVVLGKTGKGKSSALRHMVEHLLASNKRVCIVDPKGDWWGLKVAADGRSAGLPVILFGDFKGGRKGDVPINEHSGTDVAVLVATGNRPCVIGFSGWTMGAMGRFWIDFAATLFRANMGELFLVGDEFHNFAPKGKVLSPVAGECLHWSNRILSEGRGIGLVCLIASQRPQKVHNDSLTCCETLVAMGVNHPADRDAVKDWIDGCGDREIGNTVLNALAGLGRGEAYVWSPEIKFGPELVKFPIFETFDSFAPPQLQKKVSEGGWADVNLDEVKARLAKVIEERKADDPRELRRCLHTANAEIAKLKKAMQPAGNSAPAKEVVKIKEVLILKEPEIARLEKVVAGFQELSGRLQETLRVMKSVPRGGTALPINVPAHRSPLAGVTFVTGNFRPRPHLPMPKKAEMPGPRGSDGPTGETNGKLALGEMAVLRACIQFPDGLTRQQLTTLTGYKRSTRDTYIARLRDKNFVAVHGDQVLSSEDGRAALPDAEPLPTGDQLRQYWLDRLPEGERTILQVLIEAYPEPVARDTITERTGYKRSTRDTYLARMSAKEIIQDAGRGMITASETLYEISY